MTSTVFYATLLLAANFALIAAYDCECSPEKLKEETTEVFDFLSSLPDDVLEKMPPVPGELSVLASCEHCVEKNRRKRKIDEWVKKARARNERSPAYFRAWRHTDESRNKCPLGYRRVSYMCVAYDQ